MEEINETELPGLSGTFGVSTISGAKHTAQAAAARACWIASCLAFVEVSVCSLAACSHPAFAALPAVPKVGHLKTVDSQGDVSFSPPELVEATIRKGVRCTRPCPAMRVCPLRL